MVLFRYSAEALRTRHSFTVYMSMETIRCGSCRLSPAASRRSLHPYRNHLDLALLAADVPCRNSLPLTGMGARFGDARRPKIPAVRERLHHHMRIRLLSLSSRRRRPSGSPPATKYTLTYFLQMADRSPPSPRNVHQTVLANQEAHELIWSVWRGLRFHDPTHSSASPEVLQTSPATSWFPYTLVADLHKSVANSGQMVFWIATL